MKKFCLIIVVLLCVGLLGACGEELRPVETTRPTERPSVVTTAPQTTEPPVETTEPPVETTAPQETDPPAKPTEPAVTEPTLSWEDKVRQVLAERRVIPESDYTWKVFCTPSVGNRGWGLQFNPVSRIDLSVQSKMAGIESVGAFDFTYSDEQCPDSYLSYVERYDEEFFENHFLLSIHVITRQGLLPEVARIDTGEAVFGSLGEFPEIISYIGNVDEDAPMEERQIYTIIIELPASYRDVFANASPNYGFPYEYYFTMAYSNDDRVFKLAMP